SRLIWNDPSRAVVVMGSRSSPASQTPLPFKSTKSRTPFLLASKNAVPPLMYPPMLRAPAKKSIRVPMVKADEEECLDGDVGGGDGLSSTWASQTACPSSQPGPKIAVGSSARVDVLPPVGAKPCDSSSVMWNQVMPGMTLACPGTDG